MGSLWSFATTPAPVAGEGWGAYLFFVVVLIGAEMTPYEMFFFSRRGCLQGLAAAVPLPDRLLVGNDRATMADLANGRLANAVGTATIAVSVVVWLAAFPLLVLARAGVA